MSTLKQAADSLLSKGDISQEEYDHLKTAECFEKEANMRAIGNFIKDFAFPIAAVGAVGLAGKEALVDPLIRRSKIKSSFEMMPKKVPQLAEKNKKDIQDYFNVVKTFSPKSASNPLVAGALVNKMMEFGGVDHKLVQDIAAIEQGLERPSIVQTGAEAAAKSMMAGADD